MKQAKERWIPKNIGYAFVIAQNSNNIEKFIKMSGKVTIDKKYEARLPFT